MGCGCVRSDNLICFRAGPSVQNDVRTKRVDIPGLQLAVCCPPTGAARLAPVEAFILARRRNTAKDERAARGTGAAGDRCRNFTRACAGPVSLKDVVPGDVVIVPDRMQPREWRGHVCPRCAPSRVPGLDVAVKVQDTPRARRRIERAVARLGDLEDIPGRSEVDVRAIAIGVEHDLVIQAARGHRLRVACLKVIAPETCQG